LNCPWLEAVTARNEPLHPTARAAAPQWVGGAIGAEVAADRSVFAARCVFAAESSSCNDFKSRETRTSAAITGSSIESSYWKEVSVPQLLGAEPLSAFHAA
jgi:hypothetical protein